MLPKLRLFAAPFVLTVAAACGSPQPAEPIIMTNPPAPMPDAGVDEPESAADAALPNMPDERDPISGEPAPQ